MEATSMQLYANTKNEKRLAGWLSALSTALTMVLTAAALSALTTAPVMGQTSECTLATVKGSYGLVANGTLLGVGPFSAAGILTTNGAGSFTYSFTQNVNGVISSGTVPGTYTLDSNCSGTATFANGETFAAVVVNGAQEVDLISTTPSSVQSVVAKRIQ
jgi:hypothetical protein